MTMQLSRVIIFTNDVKRLSEFYMSCFGLSTVGEADAGWTELSGGSCNIAFHELSEPIGSPDGVVKLVFGSNDVAGEKLRLEALGVKMSEVVEFGQIHLCDGQDPDGNWFQISSRGS